MSTPPVNSCNSSAGLVEKYINSAYDNVKAVADNLDYLDQIYQFLLQYGLITNIAIKAPVQAVATSPITLSGNQVLTWSAHSGDYSVFATTGMRVLVLGQTNPVENGIYDVKNNAWTRSVDFDGPKDVVDGTLVFSSQGDVWQVDGPQYSLVPGTDPIIFKDIDLFAREALKEATEKAQEAAASAAAALASEQAAKVSEDNAASSETHASNSAAAAAISETNAKVSEDAAKVSENNAKASQIAAQNSASLAEGVTNNSLTFATTAAGIAGTTNGQYFRVPQGSGATLSFIYYLNSSGTAQVVAEMPGKGAITNNIRTYSSLAVAQADVTAGNILNGAYCYIRSTTDDSALATEMINNGGTLQPTGRKLPSSSQIDGIAELISDVDSNALAMFKTSDGMTFFASAPDGGVFLPGMVGALQDQYAIRSAGAIRSGIDNIQSISEVVGSDSSFMLSTFRDVNNVQFMSVASDGGVFLRGIAGALQDSYAIKNAGDIKAGIADIADVKTTQEAMKPILVDRLFYGMNKNGELVSQAARIGRVTRRQKTGYNLNSWPQGKLCIDSNGRIYCGYNSAPAHGGSGTVPVITYSDDDGVTWSTPVKVVTGENYARGTDWWSLGVDADNHLWGIVRSRGANNQVGVTFYNLYKSTDGGTTWTKVGGITSVTQTINGVEYVPELFHDMCFVPTTGRMITGYHFANSSRVGFMSFDISDPLNTIVTQDVIAHGEYSTTTYCEPTIAVEYDRNSTGTIYGGIRTQTNAYPSQLYFMNPDLTGFTRFNAPESVQYSPMTIRRINGQFILLTIERYNTGAMNLWFGTPTDFYGQASSNFWKLPIGNILDEVTVGASNVGVQDMEIHGDYLYFAWSNETQNTYADTYIGRMNIVNPSSLLNNEYLEGL